MCGFDKAFNKTLEPLKTFVSRVCRVKRMTCRLKSDYGSSVVRPCSLRKVLRVIWSTKFSDKGSERELSKPAGRSASEPRSSLEKTSRSCRPCPTKGKTEASILTITTATDRWTSGVTGETRRRSHTTMNTGGPYRCLQMATSGYKATKFHRVGAGVGVAHSTFPLSKTT